MNNSYVAANEFPYKIFRDEELVESLCQDKIILARHVQLSPTNTCNLNCSFCSCQERNKKAQWQQSDIKPIVSILKEIKTQGVTITGGGEPLLFKYLSDLLQELIQNNIAIGLVSNGTVPIINSIKQYISSIVWCRFSFSDDREFDSNFINNVSLWLNTGVDLAFSYVVTEQPNINNIINIINFANTHKFTHIRLVSDILDSKSSEYMSNIKLSLKLQEIDDNLVIYQPRNNYTKGTKNCLISLLKPMIYSDGCVYPCCGAQYAISTEKRKMPHRMQMGHYSNLPEIIKNQTNFNGSMCDVCYYSQYNTALENLLCDMEHLEFI